MLWRKKITVMLLILLLGLAVTWAAINRKTITQRAVSVKDTFTRFAAKIPLIGKIFTAKTDVTEKTEEEKPPEEAAPIEVKAFKITQIHFTDTLPFIGSIRGFKQIDLHFEINGIVSGFNFREGDLVEEGDIIAEIHHEDAQLKVKFREAKLGAAKTRMMASKKKLEQHQLLAGIGAILKVKLEEVELEYQNTVEEFKAAQIELESAKLEMEKTYLRSPIDGVLENKDIETGEYVTSNVKIAGIGQISEVYIEMGIIEKDLERISLGQKMKFKVDTYSDEEFEGEIDNIFPTIEGKSRTITVWARVPNPQNKLLSGMFSRGTITVYEKEDAIIIPPLGIEKTDEGYKVFVIDSENIIHPKIVDVEYTGNPEYWVIASGLEPDELTVNEVVTAQLSQLKEGDKVEILETEEYTF